MSQEQEENKSNERANNQPKEDASFEKNLQLVKYKKSPDYLYSRYGDCALVLINNIFKYYGFDTRFLYRDYYPEFNLYGGGGCYVTKLLLQRFFHVKEVKFKPDNIKLIRYHLGKKKLIVVSCLGSNLSAHVYLLTGFVEAPFVGESYWGTSLELDLTHNSKILGYQCVGRGRAYFCEGLKLTHHQNGSVYFTSHTSEYDGVEYFLKQSRLLSDLNSFKDLKEQCKIFVVSGIHAPLYRIQPKLKFKSYTKLHKILLNFRRKNNKMLNVIDDKPASDLFQLFLMYFNSKHETIVVRNLSGDCFKYTTCAAGRYCGIIEVNAIKEGNVKPRIVLIRLKVCSTVPVAAIKVALKNLFSEQVSIVPLVTLGFVFLDFSQTLEYDCYRVDNEIEQAVVDANLSQKKRHDFIVHYKSALGYQDAFLFTLNYLPNGTMDEETFLKYSVKSIVESYYSPETGVSEKELEFSINNADYDNDASCIIYRTSKRQEEKDYLKIIDIIMSPVTKLQLGTTSMNIKIDPKIVTGDLVELLLTMNTLQAKLRQSYPYYFTSCVSLSNNSCRLEETLIEFTGTLG